MAEDESWDAPARADLVEIGRLSGSRNAQDPLWNTFAEPAPSHLRVSATLTTLLTSPEPKPVALTGPAGVGKTTLFRHVARQLMQQGWSFFEAGAEDIMAGMIYVGMIETRVKKLITRLAETDRLIWYMPEINQLVAAGSSSNDKRGVLDLLVRHLAEGRLRLIGECNDLAWNVMQQRRPQLRSLFRTQVVEEIGDDEVVPLAERIAAKLGERSGAAISAATLRQAIDLSSHYLHDQAAPGRFVRLLAGSAVFAAAEPKRAKSDISREITRDHLLASLTALTGLPRIVLDERERLDPKLLSEHFSRRIMGQQEAVDVLVERIAMLKAGLLDSTRPIGVFLLTGPTGTGKTEVVKALAQFLFGSADRMIRIDMSELRSPGAASRIIGQPGGETDQESLASRVRTQPFSVVLLDEFEKADASIWDLFLQVFDDARLTDAAGRPVDFRHTLIVMTSNLGATAHKGAPIGFFGGRAALENTRVTESMSAVFRPEFINRIDRVVVFQPLSRATMRVILKKELGAVLQRRGFRERPWAVEWADSAIEFLLETGFSPDMGARPLRRAIEQHLLGPLALTIAEARFPEGDQFLFVSHVGNGLRVEFVDPDADDDAPAVAAGPARTRGAKAAPLHEPKQLLLDPDGHPDAIAFLTAGVEALTAIEREPDWLAERARLLASINAPEFWQSEQRTATLSRFEQMDRIEAMGDSARSLLERLEGPARRGRTALGSVVRPLALQLHIAQAALADLKAGIAWEKSIEVRPVATRGHAAQESAEWCRQLVSMYERWADARGFQGQRIGLPGGGCRLSFAGAGVQRLLGREAGLHVLERSVRTRQIERCTAWVRDVVDAAPDSAVPDAASAAGARVVRRYRVGPPPSVRDLVSGWRTALLDGVLAGEFDLH